MIDILIVIGMIILGGAAFAALLTILWLCWATREVFKDEENKVNNNN